LKALKLPINSQNAAATTSVSLAGNVDASQLVDPSPDPTTTPAVGGNYNTSITVYDSLGTAHQLTLNLQKTAADTWTATLLPTGDPLDDLGNGAGSASPSVTLQFNSDGSLLNVNGNTSPLTIPLTFNPDATNANPAQGQTINIDVSKLTQIANSSSVSVDTSDGSPGGTLSTFSVGQDGTMTAVYSNGTTKSVGQIAMTDFRNPDGLQRAGNNLYTVGNNSGNPQYTVPGTGTLGTIATGQLEGSNVDLAVQLAQMIQAQQGYNANTKVVSTTDAMLQALMTTVQ
jgi:flagellar hook protein FlgE